MIKIKSDKIIIPDGIVDGYLYIDDGKITGIEKRSGDKTECYDCTGNYVTAGFIDMHTHGAGGYPFINNTLNDVISACDYLVKHGATSILPTVTAGSFESMKDATVNVAIAMRNKLTKSNVIGAHLEGPYLSASQCGAQCPKFITKPVKADYESLLKDYGDVVKRWTYAPENDEDGEFCKYLTERGVIASIGHSDATYKDVLTAVNNGSNLVTHLYSCTSTVTRDKGFRSLGVIESAYLLDELFVEIIADGKHLPIELIKMILKIKGLDKVIACTDSLAIAGTDVKSGTMSGTDFIVEDGVCKLKDRSAFAGSIATCDRLVRVLTKDVGLSMDKAVKTLTENPARLLKVNKGKLCVGYDADIVVFDDEVNIKKVMVNGKFID